MPFASDPDHLATTGTINRAGTDGTTTGHATTGHATTGQTTGSAAGAAGAGTVANPIGLPDGEPDTPEAGRRPARWWYGRRADITAAAIYLAAAFFLLGNMWLDPTGRAIRHNFSDQALFEWLLAYAAHSVTHLTNPFYTHLLNSPLGVNLAANTSIIVPGVVFAPVTLTLGPAVTFLLVLTLNVAATAFAWYFTLSRTLVRSRPVALLAGFIAAFAPSMVTHANSHLNLTAQYVLPLIVWQVFRLREPGHAVRNGLILGVLVIWQYTLSSELLFFIALASAVMIAVFALSRRELIRGLGPRYAAALGVAAGLVGVALAYPVWLQFFGPQTYHGTGFSQLAHSEDLLGLGAFPHQSLAGYAHLWHNLTSNLTEENSFLGPGLLITAVVAGIRLRRRLIGRALGITGLVFAVLALGPRLNFNHHTTRIRLPYALLAHLPLFDSALPGRMAMLLAPIIATMIALLLDRPTGAPMARRTRKRWAIVLVVALLPLVPPPLPTINRAPVPRFISSGDWRRYVSPGGVLVPAPLTSDSYPDGQRWQAAAKFGFTIPAGFFLGPGGPNGRSQIGPVRRPTQDLLLQVAQTGVPALVGPVEQAQARQDLAYWHAQVVVLSDGGPGSRFTAEVPALLTTLTRLLGPAQRVDDVWLWRVSPGG